MAVKDIGDLAAEKFLSSAGVDARIAFLLSGSRPPFSEDELQERQEELDSLVEFRDEVTAYTGPARWNNGMTLIADRAWNEWAEDEAESLYGRATLDSGYFDFPRFERELQNADYTSAILNEVTFWFANG